MSSSYSHLLNSYLTTPLKPGNFQTNNDTISLNPTFYKTDNQLQYSGLNQSLLPQGSSLTQQTMNPEQYETNYVPNHTTKRQSVRSLSRTLDNPERHAYMHDPPVRQTNKPNINENQGGTSTRELNIANKSPDLETIRKKHEQNIAQAFEDLLKFKPSETLPKPTQTKPKANNYSNILKDIDACVNDMKKYAARPILPLVHKTNPDYDSFEFEDRKRSIPLSDISNLAQELPHSGGAPHRPSEVEASLQMPSLSRPLINEGLYSIDNFLPNRSGAVTGNTQRAHLPQTHNLASSNRAINSDYIHHLPTNRNNSAVKLPPQSQNIENIIHHKQSQPVPVNQKEHDFVNAIKENLNKESNMSFSNELVDLLARTLLKVMQSTTNTTTASTSRNQNIMDEGINISSIKTSPRPHHQPQNTTKPLNLEKTEPVNFFPISNKRESQTQTETQEENTPITPFIQGPHQNYYSAQFGGSTHKETEFERPPPAKHSYTISFSGDEHLDKNLFLSNTLQHHHHNHQPVRTDHSEEKSHQRNSSVQIHESPYGENISPNIFDQTKHRLSSTLHGLPRPNLTKTAGFAESLRRERSTSASKLRATLNQQDKTLNLNTKTSDSFMTRPSHLGDQKPFTFLSGSKSRINTRETDFHTVSNISKEVFVNDVKSNIENAFMEKVQSMQQSFTAFLKQKIDEIHDNNTQNTSRKDSRVFSSTYRNSTPQKLQATATFSSRPLSYSGTNFPSFDNKVTLLKTSSASKPSRVSKNESTPSLKSSLKEERAAEFPRKTTEKDLQKSLSKQGPKWKDIQFQEEQEIDRIILSYL